MNELSVLNSWSNAHACNVLKSTTGHGRPSRKPKRASLKWIVVGSYRPQGRAAARKQVWADPPSVVHERGPSTTRGYARQEVQGR